MNPRKNYFDLRKNRKVVKYFLELGVRLKLQRDSELNLPVLKKSKSSVMKHRTDSWRRIQVCVLLHYILVTFLQIAHTQLCDSNFTPTRRFRKYSFLSQFPCIRSLIFLTVQVAQCNSNIEIKLRFNVMKFQCS